LYLSLLQEILLAILNVFAAYVVQRNGHHFVPTKVQFAQVHQTHAAAILSSVVLEFVLDITDNRPLGLAAMTSHLCIPSRNRPLGISKLCKVPATSGTPLSTSEKDSNVWVKATPRRLFPWTKQGFGNLREYFVTWRWPKLSIH
jgi:hypothetical protein